MLKYTSITSAPPRNILFPQHWENMHSFPAKVLKLFLTNLVLWQELSVAMGQQSGVHGGGDRSLLAFIFVQHIVLAAMNCDFAKERGRESYGRISWGNSELNKCASFCKTSQKLYSTNMCYEYLRQGEDFLNIADSRAL